MAKVLSGSEVVKNPVRVYVPLCKFNHVPPEAMRETLIGVGLQVWQADGLIEDYAHYSRGEASEVATGVQDSTGKPPRSFDEFARDYAHAFSPVVSK